MIKLGPVHIILVFVYKFGRSPMSHSEFTLPPVFYVNCILSLAVLTHSIPIKNKCVLSMIFTGVCLNFY